MALKNYYVILGIGHAEELQGIRCAFRDLARRYHPDRAGPSSTRAFQEIQEAYRVLSDPDARHDYDQRLRQQSDTTPSAPITRQSPPGEIEAEPLIPDTRSLARDFRIRPSREAMLDRFLRNFSEPHRPKGEQVRSLTVEVVLDPAEAERGGLVTIGVPVFVTCRPCGGTGRVWLYRCEYCWGEGVVESEQPVRVQVPPLVRDGTVVELPLGGLGIHNFYLRVILRVGG